ncbi:MAG: YadA C-terminal domain-containing protein [Vibrio splendidus]
MKKTIIAASVIGVLASANAFSQDFVEVDLAPSEYDFTNTVVEHTIDMVKETNLATVSSAERDNAQKISEHDFQIKAIAKESVARFETVESRVDGHSSAIVKNASSIADNGMHSDLNSQVIAQNTQKISEHDFQVKAIAKESVARFETVEGRVDGHSSAIVKNASSIADNGMHSDLNSQVIAQNTQTLDEYTPQIDRNRQKLSKHSADIATAQNTANGAMHMVNDNSDEIWQLKQVQKDIDFDTGRALGIAKQNREDLSQAGTKANANEKAIGEQSVKVAHNEKAIEKQSVKVAHNEKAIEKQAVKVAHNSAGIAHNSVSISHNSAGISHNQNRLNDHEGRIDSNAKDIYSNKMAIDNNSSDILDLRKDLERQGKELSGAIAGVAAMTNIPHQQSVGQFSVGAGIGHYNSESALAVGVGYRYSDSLTTQLGVSMNSGNDLNPVIGAGVAFSL